ncbi:MAG: hypothetical protein U5J78_01075 [Parasphingorhabdus sp.]|nr:hypothetical protein [Parasphingorhabdus sp.]
MTSKLKLLVTSAALSVAIAGANPAFAAGTASGTDITNNVTVNFQVGGVSQTAQVASDTFKVDRKINLTVAELGNATTTVAPGQAAAVTTFTVTNTSNSVLDFTLAGTQQTGGTAKHGGTDNFNVTGLQVFVDVNNNGTYEPGTDTATFIDELAADASRTVFVIGNIPGAQANGSVAGVILTATANEGGVAATQGAVVTQTAGANNAAAVDTVFADVAGSDDVARDGKSSARDDYTVGAANLSVVKTSRVVSDPFNGTTNPKAIPGAVIEYCIAITNGAGASTATTVAISDPVPANLTYDGGFGVLVNGTTGGPVCTVGATAGSFSAGVVSGTIPSVAAGQTRNLVFRATVN